MSSNMEGVRVASGVRKYKKKQAHDRIKQAEKKKRRLEKALATSAAIRSELEKKKQKKKEEQERLDEECAAIAEAVALHVLIGEEDDHPASRVGRRIIHHQPENHRWFPNPPNPFTVVDDLRQPLSSADLQIASDSNHILKG